LSPQDHILLFTVIHQLLILFDRVAYQEHLAHMQTALDDATKAASVFWLINDYMHDLKTPWGLLQAATDPRSGCVTADDFRERISRYSQRAHKTLAIVNRILARDRQRISVQVDLQDAIREILDAHSDMKVVSFLPSELPCIVLGDPSDLDILIINLIKNAKEAARPELNEKNGVSISLQVENHHVVLRVSDTGSGMTPEMIDSILYGQAKTTKRFGSGVGTRAILRIVKEHQATLRIKSTLGVGSTFSVFFPSI